MHSDSGRCGNQAFWKAHAPRQPGRNPVIAVAGGETAEASEAVAHGGSGSGEVEHCQARNAVTAPLPHEGEDAGKETSEPGEAGAIEEHRGGVLDERLRIFQDMPELGTDDSGNGGDGDDPNGVGIDFPAAEVQVQDPPGTDGGQPEHDAESPDRKMTNVNIRIHVGTTSPSIASTQRFGDILGIVSHANIHKDFPVLFTEQEIARRTAEIGWQIDDDYAGQSVVLVGVLKGAAIFLADLSRRITIDCTFDFVAVSSYGKGQRTSGAVKMIKDLDQPIEGKNIIVVEDILDTGLTLCFLRSLFEQHKPRSLRIAALLDKPSRRLEKIDADYVGFKIPNHFVVGYGMDYAERFRNVPDIRLMPPDYPELH